MDLSQSRCLVTGGAGFIGAHLCRRLLAEGAQVTALETLITGRRAAVADLLPHERFTLRIADVCEPSEESLEEPFDLVLHLASLASPRHYARWPMETLRCGSVGTLRMIDLAQRHGARLVFTSTSEVYGDPDRSPQREDYRGSVDPVGPRACYDESKRFGEAALASARRHQGIDTGIVRIFNTYGPGMAEGDGRAVPALLGQASRNEPMTIQGDGGQTRSFCFIDDMIDGILAMAGSEEPGPMNLGNPEEVSIADLAGVIRRVCGSSSPVHHLPPAPDDPRIRCPDITLARQRLGWQPLTSLEDGLTRTLAHARQPTAVSAPSPS